MTIILNTNVKRKEGKGARRRGGGGGGGGGKGPYFIRFAILSD